MEKGRIGYMGGTKQLTGKVAEIGEKALRDVTDILDSEQIPYVLEGGTLLGIVRDNRLLPWDTDLDLTITRSYARRLLSARWKFWLKGYGTRVFKHRTDWSHFKKGTPRLMVIQIKKYFFFKDFNLVDIFIKDLADERYYWTVAPSKKVLKSTPRHYYEKITQRIFKDKAYSIPEEYDAYLQSRYGDWRTPKETWDFTKDDLSIEKNK